MTTAGIPVTEETFESEDRLNTTFWDQRMDKVHISRTKSTSGASLSIEAPEMARAKHSKREAKFFEALLILWQILIVIIFAVWFDYPTSAEDIDFSVTRYNYFRDVSVMIFFGFGFLMTFLRRYGYR